MSEQITVASAIGRELTGREMDQAIAIGKLYRMSSLTVETDGWVRLPETEGVKRVKIQLDPRKRLSFDRNLPISGMSLPGAIEYLSKLKEEIGPDADFAKIDLLEYEAEVKWSRDETIAEQAARFENDARRAQIDRTEKEGKLRKLWEELHPDIPYPTDLHPQAIGVIKNGNVHLSPEIFEEGQSIPFDEDLKHRPAVNRNEPSRRYDGNDWPYDAKSPGLGGRGGPEPLDPKFPGNG